jgi:hypothetical protein
MTQNSLNNTASEFTVDKVFIDGSTISTLNTNGDLVLAPNGTGAVSVTTAPVVPSGDRADSLGSATNSWDNVYADGVTFDDGANILATYTDQTIWTPGIAFGGASVGITYTGVQGVYVRMGNIVFIYGRVVLSNKGSSVGLTTITGLPFPVNGSYAPPPSINWDFIDLAVGYTVINPSFQNGTSVISLNQAGDNVGRTAILDTAVSNTSIVVINGFYYI